LRRFGRVVLVGDDVVRVLHVSDLHVNPTSWAVIRSIVEEFEVDVVVDTGDIVHQGTTLKNRHVDEISSVDAPYVYVRERPHARDRGVLPGGSWLFQQGSTGASGINALRNEDPTPITLTVLYFDDRTGELEAWDDITLGGLGLTSAEIERHLAARFVEDPGEAPSITPAPSRSTAESPG